jgi:hypothetical protein
MHQRLEAVYRGPDPAASGVGIIRGDREFADPPPRPGTSGRSRGTQRAFHTAGVVALATTAAALALALFTRPGEHPLEPIPHGGVIGLAGEHRPQRRATAPRSATDELGEPGVAAHQAQVDYGRVIAGRGFLSTRGDGPPVLTDTFTVGTRFSTEPPTEPVAAGRPAREHPRQLRAGTDIEWTQASPAPSTSPSNAA